MRPIAILAFLAACDSKSTGAPSSHTPTPEMTVTRVACLMQQDAYQGTGPNWCISGLEKFLEAHPDERIANIVPIEYRTKGGNQGTQELLVVHSSSGTWPIAKTLTVIQGPCGKEPARTQPKDFQVDPQHCADLVEMLKSEALLVVPLTSQSPLGNSPVGTTEIVFVKRKLDVLESPAPKSRPGD